MPIERSVGYNNDSQSANSVWGNIVKFWRLSGLALGLLAGQANATGVEFDGVYRCAVEQDDSKDYNVMPGTEIMMGTWLTTMTTIWPFGLGQAAGECEDVGSQRTCRNTDASLVYAFNADTKKFYQINESRTVTGEIVERRTLVAACALFEMKYPRKP